MVEVLCQIASLLKFKVVVQAPKDEENRFADANQVITEPLEMEDIDFKVDYFILATHHRDDDMAEGLELRTTIYLGTFIKFLRDVLKKRMKHPQGERLVDRYQNNDRCGKKTPYIPFKERQHISCNKCDGGHGSEN